MITHVEALLGRELRTLLSLIKPSMKKKNSNESISNPKTRKFNKGDLVYARDFQNKNILWKSGRIIGGNGSVVYDVLVGNEIWKKHINQLRRRSNETCENAKMLMDTFSIPVLSRDIQEVEEIDNQKYDENESSNPDLNNQNLIHQKIFQNP